MKKLRLDVWSDIACPWCYVGKRRLEAALGQFAHRDEVEVVWRSFELDPGAPRERDQDHAAHLAQKYRTSRARAEAMIANMTAVGASEGIEFRFDRLRAGNTFDAHRVLQLARTRGLQDAVKERLMRGYFSEGAAMGAHETLVGLASAAGLEAELVRTTLASGAFADEVRGDEAEAHALGIGGVPFFVLAGRYGVSGAQPPALLLSALERAHGELPELPAEASDDSVMCGPDGCAVPAR